MATDARPTAILIAGPTASGKSQLALALAEHLGGTVINADSMQVYRESRILTARPTTEDEARAPHALYGCVSARDAYSAGRYAADAASAIAESRAQGRVPIIVGGTGLYFRTLTDGLSPIPPVPEPVRRKWRERAAELPPEVLHRELASRDAAMAARLSPTDPQRVTRALEVWEGTGRSLAEWQAEPGVPTLPEDGTRRIVLTVDRDDLRRRCDARFDRMVSEGALEEAGRLARLKLKSDLPIMRALGLRSLMHHLEGLCDLEAAVEIGKSETRQYVKRQLTWLSRNMKTWKAIEAQQMKTVFDNAITFIRS